MGRGRRYLYLEAIKAYRVPTRIKKNHSVEGTVWLVIVRAHSTHDLRDWGLTVRFLFQKLGRQRSRRCEEAWSPQHSVNIQYTLSPRNSGSAKVSERKGAESKQVVTPAAPASSSLRRRFAAELLSPAAIR